MNSFLVVLEAAALLTARFRPSHIGELCSWGLNLLSPRYNSNYLEETSSLKDTALLTARFRPVYKDQGHIGELCSRGLNLLSPRCNSNYLEETPSLKDAALLTARFRPNTALCTRRVGTRPAPTVSLRCNINFLGRI